MNDKEPYCFYLNFIYLNVKDNSVLLSDLMAAFENSSDVA